MKTRGREAMGKLSEPECLRQAGEVAGKGPGASCWMTLDEDGQSREPLPDRRTPHGYRGPQRPIPLFRALRPLLTPAGRGNFKPGAPGPARSRLRPAPPGPPTPKCLPAPRHGGSLRRLPSTYRGAPSRVRDAEHSRPPPPQPARARRPHPPRLA